MRKSVAYDPATGTVVGVCNFSQAQVDEWTARGLTVMESPSRDADGNTISTDAHVVADGVPTAKEPPTEKELLAAAKFARKGELRDVVNRFIEQLPNGMPRYDSNLKMNVMQAAILAREKGKEIPHPVASAREWIFTVQGAYFTLKGYIDAAATLEELAAIDLTYASLEAGYGVDGAVLKDPDVTTAALVPYLV